MSKPNKANKSNYIQAGRLSPDDMAREQVKQAQISGRAKSKENFSGKSQEHDQVSGGSESSRPRSAPEE
jgi:hypothetical protein